MHGQQFAGGAFEHVFGVGDRLEHSRPEAGQLRMTFRDVLPSLGRQPHPHPVLRPRPRWFIVALLRVRDHSGIFSLARKKCTYVPYCVKPHAIDIRVNIDPVHWFLSPAKDTRSSLYLEDAATEFQVQGLELDWTIVTWDADLRWSGDDWSYHSFRGAKWTDVKKPERRQYLKNAYRVLLTRARQGMVIFVPPGAKRDKTRSPGFYEGVSQYLTDLGVPQV